MSLGILLGPDIRQILREDPEQIRELLEDIHAEDLRDLMGSLLPDEQAKVLERMPRDAAADILERYDEHEQREVVVQMPPESVAQIASLMEPDERADLFSALPDDVGERLLETLERVDPEAAEEVREIEKWPDTSAGHMMTTDFVQVSPDATVNEALERVRERARDAGQFVYTTYVLDSRENLLGVISVRDLLIAEPGGRVSELMTTNVISASPTLDQEEVARKMAKYDLNAMPVVSESGAILGVITIDDVIDVLVTEQTEDVQKIGGVEPLEVPYFQTSFLTFIKKRIFWLIVLFIGEFFTTSALRHYDAVFEAIKGSAYYIPLLISAGGNSGSQSSTLVIRGLAIGEIRTSDWWRILMREATMGVVLGMVLGAIAFVRVLMYQDQSRLFALTVGLTLVGIVATGCTIGSMIPLLLKRLRLDPATSSTPFIASLVDVVGIVVFVYMAKLVMAEVLAGKAPVLAP